MQKSGIIFKRNPSTGKAFKKRQLPSFFTLRHILAIVCLVFVINQRNVLGFNDSENLNIISKIVEKVVSPTPTPSPTLTPTPTPTPVILPTRLIINKLNINAEIEYVGSTGEVMQAPSAWENVAWFSPGMPPGGPGNAVIAGHYDTSSGRPAVFYNLKNLETGDIIEVASLFGNHYKFRVTAKEIYELNNAPTDYIFSSKGTPRLILVTCNGYFNTKINSYTKRIVIFSELI